MKDNNNGLLNLLEDTSSPLVMELKAFIGGKTLDKNPELKRHMVESTGIYLQDLREWGKLQGF